MKSLLRFACFNQHCQVHIDPGKALSVTALALALFPFTECRMESID